MWYTMCGTQFLNFTAFFRASIFTVICRAAIFEFFRNLPTIFSQFPARQFLNFTAFCQTAIFTAICRVAIISFYHILPRRQFAAQ